MKKQKSKNLIENILTVLARFQRKHWVITLIFVTLPAFWLPLLYTFFGVQLGLTAVAEQSCQLTTIGRIIMGICFAVVAIGNGATIYDEKVNG